MLILLVLGMLTLFLLMGAIGLVLATRAREASRAFATAASPQGSRSMMAKPLLEEALLKLVRGPATPQLSECLLADMYGPSVSGSLTNVTPQAGTPLLRATITGINASNPLSINGRLVTFKPATGDPTDPMTYRILRVNSGTFWLSNMRPYTPTPLPTPPCQAIVNGRAFVTEPHDAADDDNAFLAKLDTTVSGSVTVSRPSFGAGQPPTVDNDNDGVADGVWLANVLATRPAIGGGQIVSQVSYLVVDLDGRFNVNAHGATTGNTKPGLGPADLTPPTSVFPDTIWSQLMTGGTPAGQATTPSDSQRRPAPVLAISVDGRYGTMANPGAPIDPYSLRIDADARRSSDLSGNASINLFTLGELERVVRQFDNDAACLPPRLAAILDSKAQAARMYATTDSWDTPALVGDAATNTIANGDVSTISPDVACGLRFDLNRSWNGNSTNDRRSFFEDFYNVVVAAGAPKTMKTAQWCANVVAFRDNDASQAHQYDLPTIGTVTGLEPPSHNGTALFGVWNRGEFASAAELLAIPDVSAAELQQHIMNNTIALISSVAKDQPAILDAVIVPSRFAGSVLSVPPTSLKDIGMDKLLDRQISRWREPGRVNVNTCSREVWEAVRGTSGASPFVSGGFAKGTHDILDQAFTDLNCLPMASTDRDAVNRLGNVATVRSHVFAVWITLKIEDTSPNAAPASFHRLFAIVDRSVPVGYSAGENLNVRDAIRLQRILD